jgi:opine dehydrogenase
MSKTGLEVSVIGMGSGGHAVAGHLGMLGHRVRVFNRTASKLEAIASSGGVELTEVIKGFGRVELVSGNVADIVRGAKVIMVTTTADAHAAVAGLVAPYLEDGQIILLNPGRTLGAFEVRRIFDLLIPDRKVYVAEAQSLVYACRLEKPGLVRIIGVKDKVLLSTLPASDIRLVSEKLKALYTCFFPVQNGLITSLENVGAIFHPPIVLFNAAAIERGNVFRFYNDITPQISSFLNKIDKERLMVGDAYGVALHTAEEWVSFAYSNIHGTDLYSKMKNNPAYFEVLAPQSIKSRMLMEDIPTGILPMMELGRAAGLDLPLMSSVLRIAQSLLDWDFYTSGRTLSRLGLAGKSVRDIIGCFT